MIITIQNAKKFIEKYKDKVDWYDVSRYQKLSEKFIEKYKDHVDWYGVSRYQKLSEDFIQKHGINPNPFLYPKTNKTKKELVKEYANKHGLKFDGTYLYAFRKHDMWGRGSWNKTIFYKPGKYYRDWHCDENPLNKNSYGIGIWPSGDTAIKVHVADWGVAVESQSTNKARVWGFTMLKKED
jgi:hypothetical protein